MSSCMQSQQLGIPPPCCLCLKPGNFAPGSTALATPLQHAVERLVQLRHIAVKPQPECQAQLV